MGAGASVVAEEERSRPLDASDVATPRGESALAEVRRLRQLLAAQNAGESKGDDASPTSRMAYKMHVVAIADLLKMETIECHQVLVRKGIAKVWEPGMKTFFISHQWLGGEHPDPEGQQFDVMKQVFQNFADGMCVCVCVCVCVCGTRVG